MAALTKTRTRLPFLDWMRGLAAVIMIQGHTFHSLARPETRQDSPYVLSQFFGGIAPAVFLFLTGITFAFSIERSSQRDATIRSRILAALKRSRYLFTLAVLFRLQLWVFAYPQSSWTDLFRVDILNCMGFTMLLLAPMAIFQTQQRARMCALAGAAIAALSPVISSLDWGWLHPYLSAYVVPSYNYFSFFPWAAFLAFGMSAGTVLRMVRQEQMNLLMQWATLLGFGLVLGGHYFSSLPYSLYTKSEFWLNSPALIVEKLGVVLLAAAFAFLWTEHFTLGAWSWLRQMGTTSLIVYWVHIEIVYGRWFGSWKQNLSTGQCVVFEIVLLAAMLGLSVARTRWNGIQIRAWLPAWYAPMPRRVSGD
ncbi:MAG TPA: heparan-alpha-glucosaminide N-acetyltransferase domain-containing protein [Bryobacteraceae bacterium]|nr:heparan-alpha-glucosaminide N-acetyltransferase domain-containing protein [Bryobacteraceae bacterium]